MVGDSRCGARANSRTNRTIAVNVDHSRRLLADVA